MPEISIINSNLDSNIYDRFHALLEQINRGDNSLETSQEFQKIAYEYSKMSVELDPHNAVLFVPDIALVDRSTGILAGERGLTYIPFFEEQIRKGDFNPNDVPTLPEIVKQLIEKRTELLSREDIIPASDYVAEFIREHNINQELFILKEGTLEKGFERFVRENSIELREFGGKELKIQEGKLTDIPGREFYFVPQNYDFQEFRSERFFEFKRLK